MPLIPRAKRGRPSDVWAINEGVSFVHGFDQGHSALIMPVRPREATSLGSQREAQLWANQHGKDLEPYRILMMSSSSGSVQVFSPGADARQ
jgi:hypothetical protein